MKRLLLVQVAVHLLSTCTLVASPADDSYVTAGFAQSPYHFQVSQQTSLLEARLPNTRAGAAEALGFLRAYAAADRLAELVAKDGSAAVRREAAMALAWCGGRKQLPALLAALGDPDWSVRQGAWVSLTNITGMEFPFDALAETSLRSAQSRKWRRWCGALSPDRIPGDILDLLKLQGAGDPDVDLAFRCNVTASSTYKGPPNVLTDEANSAFWQTKLVPFPQHCTVDLGAGKQVGCVYVEQYGPGFCMTEYSLSVSADGKTFHEIRRKKEKTPPHLIIPFTPRRVRFVRITSYGSERPIYPTTFRNVKMWEKKPERLIAPGPTPSAHAIERAVRALGALGLRGGSPLIIDKVRRYCTSAPRDTQGKLMVQAAIRSLGRLRGAEAFLILQAFLKNTYWARYAADALGDFGGKEAGLALIEAYPGYAVNITGRRPQKIPRDDRPGFEAVDRMYETPFNIASALCRLDLDGPSMVAGLRKIAPLLVVNMASDYDGAMLYEPQAYQLATAYLVEKAGMRQAICDIALAALGCQVTDTDPSVVAPDVWKHLHNVARKTPGGTSYAATWITALHRGTERLPQLLSLLEHDNGWARINAAKTLMFNNERAATEQLARLLEQSRPEATFGYNGRFFFKKRPQGQDEYNAPSPCWREAFVRALGALGTSRHVPLLMKLLDDERNVLEVRYAAAVSLDRIGGDEAMEALRRAEETHPFHSIRLVAREALWRRGILTRRTVKPPPLKTQRPRTSADTSEPSAIVFIKGDNSMPNDFQIDIWRQTYSTTDSGPTYRLGKNLYILKPAAPNGKVLPLTHFTDGYVADCEVTFDGRRVVFARRGGDGDPWWHIFEIKVDGSGLRQLTSGPYHDVQPACLPDGRIVFSSSRTGLRDEYHGYLATGLTVMEPDGSDVHCIGFNLGRDNEPSVMPDGRILFSRLELFYSRLKTEITLQALAPDGTRNVTLYGPERRKFWRQTTARSRERWWGEAPPRHRVLRLTQPHSLDRNRILCATTGGITLVGPGRYAEKVLSRHNNMAVTSPFPISENRVLCAAAVRVFDRSKVDLGIYDPNPETGELSLVYNDPATADFEPRPVMRRSPPHLLPEMHRSNAYTARLMCNSAKMSREELTATRGKLVRIIEGQPILSRHHTHMNGNGPAWKNHVGTHARVLGTVPLAHDGSFHVEIPADRLIHCQVLDSDRRVVGNQLVWMYARPGETKSCVGCHEAPDSTPLSALRRFPASASNGPLKCLPFGREFSYRGKAWQKGTLHPEVEERTRTVNAVSLLGRL